MAKEAEVARTSTLLSGIRRKLRAHRRRFPGLMADWVKVGFLGFEPLLPAIAIMPRSWTRGKSQSGGRYDVIRYIELQLYAPGQSNQEANDKLLRYNQSLVDLLYSEDQAFFFEDKTQVPQTFNFEISETVYDDVPMRVRNEFVSRLRVTLALRSKDYLPVQPDNGNKRMPSDFKTVTDAVYRKVWNNRQGRLRAVKTFRQDTLLKVTSGLSLNFWLESQESERYSLGEDLLMLRFVAQISNEERPDDVSLLRNWDAAEIVKDILHEDAKLGNRLFDSFVNDITLEPTPTDRTGSYTTTVNFAAMLPKSTAYKE